MFTRIFSTYGLNGYEREMSTPPTPRRGMVDFYLFNLYFTSVYFKIHTECIPVTADSHSINGHTTRHNDVRL